MIKVKYNLQIARENAKEEFNKHLEEANSLWYGCIRLIITLSSSFLVLSTAFADKLFPDIAQISNFPKTMFMSWGLLFFAVICGIFQEIDDALFNGNAGREKGEFMRSIDLQLLEGKIEGEIELPQKYLVDGPIFFGAISINAFLLSILFMWISLFKKFYSIPTCFEIGLLGIGIAFLIFMTIYFLNKRGKSPGKNSAGPQEVKR